MRTLLSTRHLTSADGATVDAVFAGLSEQSRYLRFHTAMPRLPGSVRRSLLDVDGHDRAALVAEVSGPRGPLPVGIARLVRTGPCTAELSVAVVDTWHGLGIGRRLMTELAELADRTGYSLLQAYVLRENQRAIRLLETAFPGALMHWDGSVVQVDCPVGRRGRVFLDQKSAVLVGCEG
jgi:GNAT superfamily N-acetyltransferase